MQWTVFERWSCGTGLSIERFHGTSRPATLVFQNSETYSGHFGVPIQSLAFKPFYMK